MKVATLFLLLALALALFGEEGLYVAIPSSPPRLLEAPAGAPLLSDHPLGRFEIIAIGSFPLALFYAGLAGDLVSWTSSGFDPLSAPWPFKSPYAPELDQDARIGRLLAAVGLSLSVAVVDALIVHRRSGTLPPAPAGTGFVVPPGTELDSATGTH